MEADSAARKRIPPTRGSWTSLLLAIAIVAPAQTYRPAQEPAALVAAVRTNIPYVDAKLVFEALPEDLLPTELAAETPGARAAAWPGWVMRRDAAIRARLMRGDEDSIVNLLLFGTTFTERPRLSYGELEDLRGDQPGIAEILQGRLDDMVAGIGSPGKNERLQFARTVVERNGIDPTTVLGKRRTRVYLIRILLRAIDEHQAYAHARASAMRPTDSIVGFSAQATLFRNRGLSSDSSVFPNFAIEQALGAIKSEGLMGAGRVRRVAVVGPGLDFTDKQDGYDFYPQQTIQPFAVIDSLIRLGLATPTGLRLITFDVSPRINHHLEAARQRAHAGHPYLIELPRNSEQPWSPSLVTYWKQFGDRIGDEARAVPAPSSVGRVQVRAVLVPPAVVTSIVPQDLNIVLQRLEPLGTDDRFDLIIATNILVYYDVFEQSLALANVATMLRPGGLFLSNNFVFKAPATPMTFVRFTDVHYTTDSQAVDDRMVWYRRQ